MLYKVRRGTPLDADHLTGLVEAMKLRKEAKPVSPLQTVADRLTTTLTDTLLELEEERAALKAKLAKLERSESIVQRLHDWTSLPAEEYRAKYPQCTWMTDEYEVMFNDVLRGLREGTEGFRTAPPDAW